MSSVNLKRKKITGAEIAGTVMDDFDRFEFFFARNWKKILVAACGVIVLIAAFFGVRAYFNHRNAIAVAKFDQAVTVDALNAALQQYPSCAAAPGARLKLAALYTRNKDYAAALKTTDVLLQAGAEGEIKYRAELNRGYLTELTGNIAGAATIFEALAISAMPEVYRAEAYANAGRLYIAAKELTAASRVLQAERAFSDAVLVNLPANAPGAQVVTSWQRQANFLLAQLESGAFGPLAAK